MKDISELCASLINVQAPAAYQKPFHAEMMRPHAEIGTLVRDVILALRIGGVLFGRGF